MMRQEKFCWPPTRPLDPPRRGPGGLKMRLNGLKIPLGSSKILHFTRVFEHSGGFGIILFKMLEECFKLRVRYLHVLLYGNYGTL